MAMILPFDGHTPRVAEDAFLAGTATLIGDVEIGPQVSIWYGAVLRGDVGAIRIGARSNVQDLACVHTTGGLSEAVIGEDVVVGHGAIIHGARVGDGALVGMGAILLDNAEIGAGSVVAAGAVVTARTVIPPGVLVRGTPAKVARELTEEERTMGKDGARSYVELYRRYLPPDVAAAALRR